VTIVTVVAVYTIYLILLELYNFFFPRKDAIRFAYPFQNILVMNEQQETQLEYITQKLQETSIERGGKKTMVLQTVVLPCFVGTTDVQNVQYILKDHFSNFGKTGGSFKPRLQGLLGNGIFNSDGKQWYAHRKTSAHLFKMNKFKGNILDIFNDDLNQVIQVISGKLDQEKSRQKGIVLDIHDYLHRYTLESISRIAFGVSLGCITNPKVNFAQDFDYCTMCINDSFLNPFWLFERYFTPKGWKYFYSLYRINQYAKKIIQDRRAELESERMEDEKERKLQEQQNNNHNDNDNDNDKKKTHERNDLLSLYLDKQSFQDLHAGESSSSSADNHENSSSDAFMDPSDANMRDVILNMIIAGRDTTAQALSWAFFRLCLHSETQQKLREEVIQVFQSSYPEGTTRPIPSAREIDEDFCEQTEFDLLTRNNKDGLGRVSWNTLQSLKYMEAFCMEVLRLHPSVPKEAKEVFEDDVLPDGTPVRKGDVVAFLPWSMGRDTDLWGKDAEEFRPERFLEETHDGKKNVMKPSPFKFIAFQVETLFVFLSIKLFSVLLLSFYR
jgi:cytochrome P450